MKLKGIIAALALVLAFAAPAAAQDNNGEPKAGGVPKFTITSFTKDFGQVKSGTPLRHTFIFKNTGKADLQIKSVTPG
jgi:Protein of unknown function (DUF1573)